MWSVCVSVAVPVVCAVSVCLWCLCNVPVVHVVCMFPGAVSVLCLWCLCCVCVSVVPVVCLCFCVSVCLCCACACAVSACLWCLSTCVPVLGLCLGRLGQGASLGQTGLGQGWPQASLLLCALH